MVATAIPQSGVACSDPPSAAFAFLPLNVSPILEHRYFGIDLVRFNGKFFWRISQLTDMLFNILDVQ